MVERRLHLHDPVDGSTITFTGGPEWDHITLMTFDLAVEHQIPISEIVKMLFAAVKQPEGVAELNKLLETAKDDEEALARPITADAALEVWVRTRDGLLAVAALADPARRAKIETLVAERELALAALGERARG